MPLRVIGTTLLASAFVMVLGGMLLMRQASDGVLEGKKQSALVESSVAVDTAQRRLQAADFSSSNVNELLTQLTYEVAYRGSLGGQYHVVLQGPVAESSSDQVRPASVPDELRRRVTESTSTDLLVTPTLIQYSDGRPDEPGFAVGASLSANDQTRFPMYLVFPLTQEVQTLDVLQRAVLTTGILLALLLAAIAALVSRQVVTPVRQARLAAEQIASGRLENRMEVRGTDDLASLAESMNNMAAELQRQITQLEELSRVQQRFVSDVSHELRTPLTTVQMAAQVLYDGRGEMDLVERRSAELLQDELERFESLLADLLEISRFDAGAVKLSLDPVDMVQVVADEVDAQQAFAHRSGTHLTIQEDGPAIAEIDVRRARRILRNLITNAIEHCEGEPIEVIVASGSKAVAVAVRDHGIGFEAGQAKQVFHRFWRADPSRNRTVGGTGLGLSIAMEDARLHGGWLNAWGRPNQGAQFRLTLPKRAGDVLEVSPLPVIPRDLVPSQPIEQVRVIPLPGPTRAAGVADDASEYATLETAYTPTDEEGGIDRPRRSAESNAASADLATGARNADDASTSDGDRADAAATGMGTDAAGSGSESRDEQDDRDERERGTSES